LKVSTHGLTDIDVIGPAPGIPQRVRGRYRWHVTLRGRNLHQFLEGMRFAPNWTVDVDPAHVL
jgi:primosomal protein N' (replication factor Y)